MYSANRPESHGVYRDWRAIAESYSPPRLLLGETWVGDLAAMAAFHGHGDELQLTFNFPFIFADFTAEALSGVVAETLAALPAGECPVWTASNHDVSRFPTRWGGGDEAKARLALLVLATLPGTFVLYYGDEIAMTDVEIPAAARRDEMTAGAPGGRMPRPGQDPHAVGRLPDGGLHRRRRPALAAARRSAARNVAGQRDDPASTLRFCRDLLALRRAGARRHDRRLHAAARPPGVWVYRVGGLVVAANFAGEPACLGELAGPLLLSTGRAAAGPEPAGPATRLGPWEGVIVRAAARSPESRGRRDGHPQGRLVGERDRELPEGGGVERRRVA